MTRLLPLLTLLALLVACSDDATESCFDDPTIPECVASCMEDPSQAFCDLDDMGVPEDGPMTTDMGPCGDCGDQLCNADTGECVDCLSASDCTTAEASACGDDGSCEVCSVDDDCGHDGLPGVCVEDTGCFECDMPDVESLDCSAENPVCDETERSCRPCEANGECAGGLCLDGGCPAATDIVWVDGDDDLCDDGGTGAPATPFCEVSAALDASTEYVAVRDSGDAYGPISWTGGGTVTVIAAETGGSNVRLLSTSGTGDTVTCEDSSLTLVGLTVAGSGNQDGINASGCTLTLTDVSVSSNGQVGVSTTGGTVTLTDVSVSGNGGVGVAASAAADVTIRRSTIRSNDGGGLNLSGARFDVENTVVAENGAIALVGAGGANLSSAVSGSSFVNNTVVYNQAAASLSVGGLLCDSGFEVTNTLLFDNEAGTTTADQVDCTLVDSSEGTDPVFDTDGIHLTSSSACCVDTADDDAAPTDDIDGDERPCGAGSDIGADELCP